MRPCITWDNFVHLAAESTLFSHYYIYSSVGDWHTSLQEDCFDWYKKVSDIFNLEDSIKDCEGKCILDIDLDFFDDDDRAIFPGGVSGADLLNQVFEIIRTNLDSVSMITIAINESPGDQLWDRRQEQLKIVKEKLSLEVPIPVMG